VSQKKISLLGAIGVLIAYIAIGFSIMFSPWFSWHHSALSDLGHSLKSPVAPVFNFGLQTAGLLVLVYAIAIFRKHAKYTSYFLIFSAFLLQLIGTFDEVYGFLHLVVSVLFFISISFTSICYTIEKKSYQGVLSFTIIVLSWMLYGLKIYHAGIAVPETISSLAVAFLLVSSSVKIYLKNT